jgi:hypothetical protein
VDGTGQGFACSLSKFLFLYPGSGFTSPCPKETGNLPSARESPTCPLRRDGCLLLCPSAPGDAAALTPGLSLLPTSLESAHCLSIFCATHVSYSNKTFSVWVAWERPAQRGKREGKDVPRIRSEPAGTRRRKFSISGEKSPSRDPAGCSRHSLREPQYRESQGASPTRCPDGQVGCFSGL